SCTWWTVCAISSCPINTPSRPKPVSAMSIFTSALIEAVRDGEKGPVAIEMVIRQVQTRLERKRIGPEEWLVVTRRPLADDHTLEPKASPDATDHDTQHR